MSSIRRSRFTLVVLVLSGLMAALFGVSVSAETPTASVPVTVTASVNGHTYHLGDSITGLADGDVVAVHVDAQSPPNPTPSSIFSIEGRQCSDVSVSNSFDFTPTQGGNCANVALGSGSLHPVIPVGPPNAVADMNFTVGEGTTTFDDEDLTSHTVQCQDGDTCKLVILLQVPSATDFVSFPITFGTPATAPGAPTGVSATAGNGQASVSWTAPSSIGGSAITGYTVTSSPGARTCTTATTSCTVTGLTNFTPYTFTVTATNAGTFTSTPSSPSSAVTPLPTAPAITAATGGDASATISWSAASPVPTGYTVTSSPGAKTCTTATTSCTVSGLTNGTGYTFTVTATYGGGTVTSTPSSVVTPAAPPGPPGAPTGVAAAAGNGQAAVTWTAPADTGNSSLTGYTVTSSPGGLTCTTATTGCTVTGLANFTPYTFTVTASNAAHFTSAPSSPSSSVTPMPSLPAITAATGADASATLSWSAADPVPTDYTATSSPGGLTCTTTSTSCTVSGLTNGTPYTFTVTADYAGGSVTSAPSASVTPRAPAAPGSPTGVTATGGNGQAIVSWTAPADDGGSAITGYTVTASPAGSSASSLAGFGSGSPSPPSVVDPGCTSATTSCTVTGLTDFTAYTFTVTATNGFPLTSAASSPSASVTPLPVAPSITSVVGGDGSVTVTWSASDPAPTSYTVTGTPGGTCTTTTATTCTIDGLSNGTSYTFVVEATFAAGQVSSAASTAVAPAPPTSTTSTTVAPTSTSTAPAASGSGDTGATVAAESTLPVTGSSSLGWLVELALVLVGLGALLVFVTRRRPVRS